jgi:hypothetical protein
MNPRDSYGKPVKAGALAGEAIEVAVDGEFAVYVLLRGGG